MEVVFTGGFTVNLILMSFLIRHKIQFYNTSKTDHNLDFNAAKILLCPSVNNDRLSFFHLFLGKLVLNSSNIFNTQNAFLNSISHVSASRMVWYRSMEKKMVI